MNTGELDEVARVSPRVDRSAQDRAVDSDGDGGAASTSSRTGVTSWPVAAIESAIACAIFAV